MDLASRVSRGRALPGIGLPPANSHDAAKAGCAAREPVAIEPDAIEPDAIEPGAIEPGTIEPGTGEPEQGKRDGGGTSSDGGTDVHPAGSALKAADAPMANLVPLGDDLAVSKLSPIVETSP